MKIVIDIDDDIYTRLFDNGKTNAIDILKACNAIRKGNVLPKGHGRLIDARALDKEVINYVHSGDAESPKDCAKFSIMIITAPTIIEADKTESEE